MRAAWFAAILAAVVTGVGAALLSESGQTGAPADSTSSTDKVGFCAGM